MALPKCAEAMKILALVNRSPGLRYSAHIHTLVQAGAQVECVEITGISSFVERMRIQARILRRNGLRTYLKRRIEMNRASTNRAQVDAIATESLIASGFFTEITASQRFGGFGGALISYVRDSNFDLLLQAGAGIIPRHFIRVVPPILNVHPGILPGIRGVDPLFWAHYYGRRDWIGSTIHIVDAGIDTGRPLIRRRLSNLERGGHFAYYTGTQVALECSLLRETIDKWDEDLSEYDEGGCSKSVYRSYWHAKHYLTLQSCGWWAAEQISNDAVTDSQANE